MSIVFKAKSGESEPLYRQVESYIQAFIRSQKLGVGDVIPTLDQISEATGVSNITVRRAVSELVRKGVLETRQGAGTLVARPPGHSILWITGVNLDTPDISRFHVDQFAIATRVLREYGLDARLCWMPTQSDLGTIADAYGVDDFDGMVFAECAPDHGVLEEVRATGRPFVDIGTRGERLPNAFAIDATSVDRMALNELIERGHRDVTIITLGWSGENRFRSISEELGLRVHLGEVSQHSIRQSAVESAAFQLTTSMHDAGKLMKGIYVTDDIIARGVTRAILAADGSKARRRDFLAFVVKQEIIDLGMPVTYVTYDMETRVRAAVESLVDQLEGRQKKPRCEFADLSLMRVDASPAASVESEMPYRISSLEAGD